MGTAVEQTAAENWRRLDEIIDQYRHQPGMLIRVLQKAQEVFGYLPPEVQTHIADRLQLPVSTVSGVVTFYSLFSQEATGKYTISVCLGTACYVKGAMEILRAIEEELHIKAGETTLDRLFTIKPTRCIGACGLAPVITINDEVYGRLTPADIPSILYKYQKAGRKMMP